MTTNVSYGGLKEVTLFTFVAEQTGTTTKEISVAVSHKIISRTTTQHAPLFLRKYSKYSPDYH